MAQGAHQKGVRYLPIGRSLTFGDSRIGAEMRPWPALSGLFASSKACHRQRRWRFLRTTSAHPARTRLTLAGIHKSFDLRAIQIERMTRMPSRPDQ